MKACIILNGEVRDYEFLKSNFQNNKYDFIICADGGAKHLYKINIIPDYIIGDLDSFFISNAALGSIASVSLLITLFIYYTYLYYLFYTLLYKYIHFRLT
jgi:thiamine pyrophosphokinase